LVVRVLEGDGSRDGLEAYLIAQGDIEPQTVFVLISID
jgi:hypothetical protein